MYANSKVKGQANRIDLAFKAIWAAPKRERKLACKAAGRKIVAWM